MHMYEYRLKLKKDNVTALLKLKQFVFEKDVLIPETTINCNKIKALIINGRIIYIH